MHQNELEQTLNLSKEWLLFDALSEEPYKVMMYLYDQMGRRELALKTYADYCKVFLTESNLDPSDEMQELAQHIKKGHSPTPSPQDTPEITVGLQFPAPLKKIIVQKANLPLNNLPSPPTTFIGRTHDEDNIVTMLQGQEVRLLTLTGTGGTGKTRLAIQVAKKVLPAFQDGVFFIQLSPIHNPAGVPRAIAVALGISGPQNKERAYHNDSTIASYWLDVSEILPEAPLDPIDYG